MARGAARLDDRRAREQHVALEHVYPRGVRLAARFDRPEDVVHDLARREPIRVVRRFQPREIEAIGERHNAASPFAYKAVFSTTYAIAG